MGYNTTFKGHIEVNPPLNEKEIDYLTKFSNSRRMKRDNGPYFVDGSNGAEQYYDNDIIDVNNPPEGQPGLWCQWVPSTDGSHLKWNGVENFYNSVQWMEYLIAHFIGDNPIAKKKSAPDFDFLEGHTLNGEIKAKGEETNDRWTLYVIENIISVVQKH